MNRDYELLGEVAVYPGHPITLAYLITQVFLSYEEAAKISAGDFFCPAALGSSDIPGAGACVYEALSLLQDFYGLHTLEEAFSAADRYWSSTDSQAERDPERWRKGQEQADRVKPLLASVLKAPGGWSQPEVS